MEQLFGRGDEREVIRAFLRQAEHSGAALLLSGQSGVGKSVLIEAAVEAANADNTLVLDASGVEFEAEVSFSALNQVLLPLRDQFSQLGFVHSVALASALGFGTAAVFDRALVSDATLALLRRAAIDRPVLVAVDDLHWVDRSSAGVLLALARNLEGSRVGFLGAFRSEAETFFDPTGLPGLEVRPLGPDAASALVSTRFPMLAARVLHRVLREAQGNPLALVELPAALSEAQRTGRQELELVLPLSRRLQDLFESRVGGLPARTRQLLLMAALESSGDLSFLRLPSSSGLGPDDLRPAERARLVSFDNGTWQVAFRHPVVRSTVVAISTSNERRSAHRQLARSLTDLPERQAWHLAEAAVGPDEHVADVLEDVAHRVLRRGDAVGAVTRLLRAAELSPQHSDRGRRLAEAAYIGADVTGDLPNASRLLAEARRADPKLGGSLQVAVAASYLLLNGEGEIDTAHRLLVGTIEAHSERHDAEDNALIEALHNLFEVCIYGARPELWAPFDAALRRLTPGVPPLLTLVTNVLGDPARATRSDLDLLDASISCLGDEVDPTRIERIATAALFVDRAMDCRQALWRVVHDGREGGAVAAAISAMMVLCIDDFMAGRWEASQHLAAEGLQLCEAHGYGLLAWPFRFGMALLAAVRGEESTVRALSSEIYGWAAPRGIRGIQFYCWHARALAALGRSDFEDAYQQAAAISPAGVLTPHVPHALWVAMDLVESAERTNRHEEAAAHVRAMRAADIAALSPRLALLVAGSAAVVAPDHLAPELFDQALATTGADRWPFELARVELAYGERLRRARATAEARLHLDAALKTFSRLGAHPWLARANKELRATGLTKLRTAGFGPMSLTPQQREVALLAASGLSNKQIAARLFLSHRTVGAHLRQVFPKLGVTSRAALRDVLAATPADPLAHAVDPSTSN